MFLCLFKLFVCIFNFLLPLVVNKDVHYSIMALYLPAPIKELIKFTCVAGLDYIVIFMAAYSLATSSGI